ncbi:hypothetical protein Pelo_17820 [Pelomyxa schiedti]|nr:hypothetical protein Pelo_17820 [Pelomyxa schiedti]
MFDLGTGQYYMHSFTPEQPDLNWRCQGLEQKISLRDSNVLSHITVMDKVLMGELWYPNETAIRFYGAPIVTEADITVHYYYDECHLPLNMSLVTRGPCPNVPLIQDGDEFTLRITVQEETTGDVCELCLDDNRVDEVKMRLHCDTYYGLNGRRDILENTLLLTMVEWRPEKL